MKVTRGDSISIALVLRVSDGEVPVDLTGATFETKFPAESGFLVIPNDQHTIADQDTEPGRVLIALSVSDTEQLRVGEGQDVIIKVTLGESIKHYTANSKLSVYSPDPSYPMPASNIFIGGVLD